MEGSSNLQKKIEWDEWATKLSATEIRKEDMNKLVLNFLTSKGYSLAAQNFVIESGTLTYTDPINLSIRNEVRRDLMSGKVEDTIKFISSLYPQIIRNNKKVVFYLHQQNMIEMIRNGKVKEAVDYGLQHIAPSLDGTDQHLLEEFKCTMSLVGFEDPYKCPDGLLMGFSQLMKVVNEVNKAILTAQGEEKDSTLESLLKKYVLDYKEILPKVDPPYLKLQNFVFFTGD